MTPPRPRSVLDVLAAGLAAATLLGLPFLGSGGPEQRVRALAILALFTAGAAAAFGAALRRERPALLASPALFALAAGGAALAFAGPAAVEARGWLLVRAGVGPALAALSVALAARGDRRDLLAAGLAAVALLVLGGLAQRLWLFDALRAGLAVPDPDLAGAFGARGARATLGNANVFGGLVAAALAPAVVAARAARGRARGAATVLVILFAAGLVASASRGAVWAAVGGLGLALFDPRAEAGRLGRRAGAVLLGAAALGLAGWAAFMLAPPAEVPAALETLALRRDYAVSALELVADHPVLGVGAGLYGPATLEAPRAWSAAPHCAPLAVVAELGSLGGALLCGLAFAVVGRVRVRRPLDEAGAPRVRGGATGVAIAFVLLLLAGSELRFTTLDGATGRAVETALAVVLSGAIFRFAARPAAEVLLVAPGRARAAGGALLLAIALHALVDVDLHVDGLVALLAVLGAALLLPAPRHASPASPLVGIALGAGLLALAVTGARDLAPAVAAEVALDRLRAAPWTGDEVTAVEDASWETLGRAATARPVHLAARRAFTAMAARRGDAQLLRWLAAELAADPDLGHLPGPRRDRRALERALADLPPDARELPAARRRALLDELAGAP